MNSKLAMKNKSLIFICILIGICLHPQNASGQKIIDRVLWKQGTGNYKNYRIPAILMTSAGTLLAFCEGREAGDSGDIDILLKRSSDNGKTWSAEKVVWNDERNTCGNPCPVIDGETGRIWLFLTWNNGKDSEKNIISKTAAGTRKPYLCYSDDDGLTWSEPVDVSSGLKDPSWGWYATGPGTGIRMHNGKFNGRLVVPANHSYDDPDGKTGNGPFGYGAHVLFSDDHGKTWSIGQQIIPGCNESQVTELSNGMLLMNMRSYNGKNCRAVSYSSDGGKTWSAIQHDPQLVEPVCQASILYFGRFRGKNLHLFSNPAVPFNRTHMTIKSSFDDCKTWTNSKLVCSGPSAYSCLTKINNRQAGLFFECGYKSAYETLRFISFPVRELFRTGELIPERSEVQPF